MMKVGVNKNGVVFVVVMFCCVCNLKVLVFYYWILMVLLYSGIKDEDFVWFNWLGVCMFLDLMICF